MATAFPLGRRASGGYHTDRTRNGHGATHEPSAGLGNPGGGSTAGKAPSANTSIRTLLSRLRGPGIYQPKRNGHCPKFLRFQRSDLYVIKGGHKVGSNLCGFLFGYGIRKILFTAPQKTYSRVPPSFAAPRYRNSSTDSAGRGSKRVTSPVAR